MIGKFHRRKVHSRQATKKGNKTNESLVVVKTEGMNRIGFVARNEMRGLERHQKRFNMNSGDDEAYQREMQ